MNLFENDSNKFASQLSVSVTCPHKRPFQLKWGPYVNVTLSFVFHLVLLSSLPSSLSTPLLLRSVRLWGVPAKGGHETQSRKHLQDFSFAQLNFFRCSLLCRRKCRGKWKEEGGGGGKGAGDLRFV